MRERDEREAEDVESLPSVVCGTGRGGATRDERPRLWRDTGRSIIANSSPPLATI